MVENIVLSKNGVLIKDEEKVANIFNNFFVDIVPNLGKKTQHEFLNTTDNSQDPIENAICKYDNHPGIILIKKHMQGVNSYFVFEAVTKEKIEKLIKNLNIKKAVQSNDIPTKLVKEFGYSFSKYIATSINRCITGGTFVNAFKKAEVRSIYKKEGKIEKSNYRPINVLSNVPKIYERCLYEQMYSYFHIIFSKNQCDFRKGFNTQHMIEKMKAPPDNKQLCTAILTELFKAFDCICYDLLIADTTPYECDQHRDNLINNMELTVEKIFSWFEFNNLKANASKYHFFLSPYQHSSINIDGSVIKSSNFEKLLGITIDSDFTFEEHINTLCQKASQKLHALSRISQYLSEHKK